MQWSVEEISLLGDRDENQDRVVHWQHGCVAVGVVAGFGAASYELGLRGLVARLGAPARILSQNPSLSPGKNE